ncbi:MAG: glycosyl transferase family 2, partial [Domibacillus tundrae]
MLFSRETYKAAGGHKPLKNSLVADVHLAREVKRKGNKAVIANIAPSVTCTVYETNKETWEGFLKNSFNGIGRSKAAAGLLVLFYTVFYIVPF